MPFVRVTAILVTSLLLLPAGGSRTSHPATRHTKPTCAADNGGLTLPRGFCAVIVADSVKQPRHLVVLANGDMYVSSYGSGVIGMRDTTGDGRADVIQPWGGNFRSSEVAIRNGYLYSDATTAILRFPIRAGSLTAAGPADTLIGGLPGGGHAAKTFALADDGTMYVNLGSLTNSCQQKDRALETPGVDPCTERDIRAGIWAFKTDRTNQKQSDGVHFGAGIRNAVAMAFEPSDHSLFVMQHGRDGLAQQWPKLFDEAKSAETPAEEMFNVTKGDDFGWPYCYYDRQIGKKVLAPEYGGDRKTVGRCANFKGNVTSFPGHWAPNGLTFYRGAMFPAKYQNGAFIAFHGSWNRAPLPQQGYNIVFQPMKNGKPDGAYEVFATGFRSETPGGPQRRPSGLAVGPDGSLYVVSDEVAGRIWRIMYTGTR
jgi:glucose/arabinose dehydrogenase